MLLVVSAVVVIDTDVITAAEDSAVSQLAATISDSYSTAISSSSLLLECLKLSSCLLIRISRRALTTYSSALKAFLITSFLWPAPTNDVEGVYQESLNCSSDSSNCR